MQNKHCAKVIDASCNHKKFMVFGGFIPGPVTPHAGTTLYMSDCRSTHLLPSHPYVTRDSNRYTRVFEVFGLGVTCSPYQNQPKE